MHREPHQTDDASPLLGASDPTPRFVRFGRLIDDRFVEFAFGLGSADLMAELVLPVDAYHSFCRLNDVVHLTRDQEERQDHDRSKWRFGSPGLSE